MLTNKKLLVFFTVFIALNLCFIPLMSIYGLQTCHILTKLGFIFGCYYTSLYILLVNIMNITFIHFTKKIKFNFKYSNITRTVTPYMISTIIAILFLQILFKENHVTGISRGPIILVITSLILGITQYYGLNWALPIQSDAQETKNSSIHNAWLVYFAKSIFPIVVFCIALINFILTQADFENSNLLSKTDSILLLISYLLAWMAITILFFILNEKNKIEKISFHFEQINLQKYDYRNDTYDKNDIWTPIFDNLNYLSKTLKEKYQLITSFSKFAAKEVVNKTLSDDLLVGNGESKELAVMVVDIRNFTLISNTLPAEKVILLLNIYFNKMIEILTTSGLQIDKFMGDGILAYHDNSNAATSCNQTVEAALNMQNAIAEINKLLGLQSLPAIDIGIGIHFGKLVVGIIGAESKLEYTIIGDTVNKTSRIESATKTFNKKIVISIETYKNLSPKQQIIFESLGEITLKGISEKTELFGLK